jgi:hypothetical protein
VAAIICAFYALIALIGFGTVATFTFTDFNQQAGWHATQAVGLVVYITTGILLLLASFYIGIVSALIHGDRTVWVKFIIELQTPYFGLISFTQGRLGLPMPWIILTAISLFVLSIFTALISLMISNVTVGLLFLGIGVYFFICVWSFR